MYVVTRFIDSKRMYLTLNKETISYDTQKINATIFPSFTTALETVESLVKQGVLVLISDEELEIAALRYTPYCKVGSDDVKAWLLEKEQA